MFKCSVQSLFAVFGQSGQFDSKHERFGSQCSDTSQDASEVLLLAHILMWIDSNLMKEYLSLSYLTGWGLFFMDLKIQMYMILHAYVKITSRTALKGWTACEVR